MRHSSFAGFTSLQEILRRAARLTGQRAVALHLLQLCLDLAIMHHGFGITIALPPHVHYLTVQACSFGALHAQRGRHDTLAKQVLELRAVLLGSIARVERRPQRLREKFVLDAKLECVGRSFLME